MKHRNPVSTSNSQPMVRRSAISCLAVLFPALLKAAQPPKLGDPEWMRRFGLFLQEVNQFVLALNEDKLDRTRWERIRAAWAALQPEEHSISKRNS